MAYPIDNFQGGNCPSTHPIHLVSLFYEWIFSVGDFPFNKDGPTWAFANGDTTGYGFHADFTNGWDIDILQSALDTCGLETNGVVDNCAALQPYIDHQAASACQPEMPVVNEDIGFGHAISKLPGNNRKPFRNKNLLIFRARSDSVIIISPRSHLDRQLDQAQRPDLQRVCQLHQPQFDPPRRLDRSRLHPRAHQREGAARRQLHVPGHDRRLVRQLLRKPRTPSRRCGIWHSSKSSA